MGLKKRFSDQEYKEVILTKLATIEINTRQGIYENRVLMKLLLDNETDFKDTIQQFNTKRREMINDYIDTFDLEGLDEIFNAF